MLLENLPWSKTLIEITAAPSPMQTVNFSTMAHALSAPAQNEPNYKRLQRFFREIAPPYAGLPRLSPDC
jgi:hypothetical protein